MARLSGLERRETIVRAARPLFALKGFEPVTTREVAEAAGISEALLYRHFESKAAIYDAVLESCTQRITNNAKRFEDLPDGTATLVLAIYLIMRSIQSQVLVDGADRDVSRLVLRSLLSDGAFARKILQFASKHVVAKIERCVRAAVTAGDIDEPFDQALTAFWLSHHLATALVFYQLPVEPVLEHRPCPNREALFEASVHYALRGLGFSRALIKEHYKPKAFARSLEK